MRAIVLDHPGTFRVADVPDPTPQAGQVVVKVEYCGICGTDLHILDGEFPPTPYPITPGHEFAGTVVARGPDIKPDLPVGARVAVDPSLYCGYCRRCRAGRDNLCENWAAIGDTVNGAFAEYVAVPAVNAYRLPDNVDTQYGAMAEPLACAVHGLRRLGPVLGDPVALIGAGTMGLLLLQLLLHAGAGPVTVVDRVGERLDIARKLGAAHTVTDTSALGGARFEIAVDATGVPAVVETAIGLLDRGGRMLVFGVSPADAAIRVSPFRVYNDEIAITGSMAILHSFGLAVDLLASGAVDPRPLLAEPLPLDQYGEAVNRVRAGQGIKWHIRPLWPGRVPPCRAARGTAGDSRRRRGAHRPRRRSGRQRHGAAGRRRIQYRPDAGPAGRGPGFPRPLVGGRIRPHAAG
jgi:2-desacetyl-2-hydroxyethyl bacteriochlorophyllide A dehydrogenase